MSASAPWDGTSIGSVSQARTPPPPPVALDDQGTLKNRQQQGGGEGFSNRGKWRKPDKCLLVLFPSIPAKGLMPSFLLPSLPVVVPTTPLPAAGGVGWGSLMGKMAKLYPANAIVLA